MAFFFGDGFDLYSAITDCGTFWDGSFGGGATLALSASGRFAGSRGITSSGTNVNAPYITKTSGANDAVHHITLAYQQTATLSGVSQGFFVKFMDGTNVQCVVWFRSDGAIALTSGDFGGSQIATYTGAVTAVSPTWFAFEIEVFISATAGYMNVRKNGNTSNDFASATNLNTRAGSTNNYANKIGIGQSQALAGGGMTVDDLLWRSDPSSVAFLGDIRCFTRMPASDSSVAWSRNGGTTNFGRVSEAQQDGSTTYVYSSTVSQSDLYGIASIGTTPASTVAVVTRGYVQKSDAGTRLAAVQLQSGAFNVQSGGPSGFTTWNPSDMGSNLTLSGGNLIVTTSASATANIRSAQSQTGTKFYFEQTFGTISGTEGIGIANASASVTTASFANTAFVTSGGAVWINGVMILSSIGTVSNGSLIGIAVDLVNSLVWFRIGASGNWNGSPVYSPGGTGGQSISAFITPTTATYGYAAFNGSSSGSAITANFGASAFAGAVPSGFTAGLALAAGTALNTTWGWLYRNDLLDPATSAAWTATAVNNALIGAIVTG